MGGGILAQCGRKGVQDGVVGVTEDRGDIDTCRTQANIYSHTHTHSHAYIHTIHMCILTRAKPYMNPHTHTHTHTHTHKP